MFRLPTNLKINSAIRALIAADFLIIASSGFMSPIGAIYLVEQIQGGTLAAVGFAATVFWVSKSAFQIPISLMADAKKGERDDFMLMVAGVALAGLVQLGYFFFIREMWQVYIAVVLDGLAYALQVPTYMAIFTRHIDKNHEGVEWMFHSNAIGLGFALTAAVGGVLAERFGFRVIFLLAAGIMFSSIPVLLTLLPKLFVTDIEGGAVLVAHRKRPKLD